MRALARVMVSCAIAHPWEDVMTRNVVETPAATRNSRLLEFLRIERRADDRLLQAAKRYPQPRETGNARVVAYCRIARGHQA